MKDQIDRVFCLGDLVFAKVRGYPPWPARVEGLGPKSSKEVKYSVLFFGTFETANCIENNLFHYEVNKEKFGRSRRRGFEESMQQIEEAARELGSAMENLNEFSEERTDVKVKTEECSEIPCEGNPPSLPDRKSEIMGSEAPSNHATFVIKEESVDSEESWQDDIKHELSSSTVNSGSEESDELVCSDANMKGSTKKINEWPLTEASSASCLQITSPSSETLSGETVGMSTKEQLTRSTSSEYSTLLHQNLPCKVSCAEASCSSAEDIIGQETDTCGYLSQRQEEEQMAGERWKQHNNQSGSERDVSDEVTLVKGNMPTYVSDRTISTESERGCGKRLFECSTCKKQFLLKSHLDKHIRVHTGMSPYQCSQCGKLFRTKVALNVHMRLHTGEKAYKCYQCIKSFHRKGYLTAHMRIHTGEKPYKCSQCEKAFSQRGNLNVHMRLHTSMNSYKCSLCEKTFQRKSYLSVHMRFHMGEKPYNCRQCDKSFHTKGSLTVHMRFHTGEKHYKCSQCKKSFHTKFDLTRHMRFHTGEKQYKCSQCKKSFHTKCNLTRHTRIHTGEKPYKCSQ